MHSWQSRLQRVKLAGPQFARIPVEGVVRILRRPLRTAVLVAARPAVHIALTVEYPLGERAIVQRENDQVELGAKKWKTLARQTRR